MKNNRPSSFPVITASCGFGLATHLTHRNQPDPLTRAGLKLRDGLIAITVCHLLGRGDLGSGAFAGSLASAYLDLRPSVPETFVNQTDEIFGRVFACLTIRPCETGGINLEALSKLPMKA